MFVLFKCIILLLDLSFISCGFVCRSAVKAVLEKVTTFAFHYTARGLFEKDRFIFALLLAVEVSSVNDTFCLERL